MSLFAYNIYLSLIDFKKIPRVGVKGRRTDSEIEKSGKRRQRERERESFQFVKLTFLFLQDESQM